MPREKSPYKQVPNKDKEPPFYEIKEFILYLLGEKMLSTNTANSYETDLNKYCEYLKKYRNIFDIPHRLPYQRSESIRFLILLRELRKFPSE